MRLSLIKTPLALCSLALALPAVAWASTSERSSHIEYDEGVFVGSTIKLSTAEQFQDVMFVQKLIEVLSEESRSKELRALEKIPSERLELLDSRDGTGFWDHPTKMVTDQPKNKALKNELLIFSLTQILQQKVIKEVVAKGTKGLNAIQKKELSRISPDYLGLFTPHSNSGDYRRHHRFGAEHNPISESPSHYTRDIGRYLVEQNTEPDKSFQEVRTFWNTKSKGAKPPKVITHDQGLFYKWRSMRSNGDHYTYHDSFVSGLYFRERETGPHYFGFDCADYYYIRRDHFNVRYPVGATIRDPGLYRSAINDGPGFRKWDRFNVPSSQDAFTHTTKKPDVVAEVPGTEWRSEDHKKVFEGTSDIYIWWSNKIESSKQVPKLRYADPGKYAPAGIAYWLCPCDKCYNFRSNRSKTIQQLLHDGKQWFEIGNCVDLQAEPIHRDFSSGRRDRFNVAEVATQDQGLRAPVSSTSFGQNIRRGSHFNVTVRGVTPKKDLVPGADCRKITAKFLPSKEEVTDFQLKPVLYEKCGIKPGQVGLSQENRYVVGRDKKKIFLSSE